MHALRNSAFRLIASVAIPLGIALSFVTAGLADGTVSVTGGFSTTEAGVFTVSLIAKPASGCQGAQDGSQDFGSFVVDAIGQQDGVAPEPISLCVLYTDTKADRGPFTVQLSIDSFELKADQTPTFEGADQAHFQIPNRYLVLSTVGRVTGGNTDQGVGVVSDVQADAGHDFSSGPLQIAAVAAGTGTVSSVQELGMTLNVPAGVYPGEYDSTITVETYTGP